MSKNSQEPCECACLFSHAFTLCRTSKFRLASNISYSAFSVLQKTSENSFSFCYHHFSGIFVHLFNHSHIPHLMLISFPSISFSGCMSRTSHIQLLLFSCFPFIFLANSFFWLSMFGTRPMGLSLGDKEATQLQTLLSVYELNNRYPVTIHNRLWKNWRDSSWSYCTCYLCRNLWTKELAAKLEISCAYTIAHLGLPCQLGW